MKFIRYYSLEIFTALAMTILCGAVFFPLNAVQKLSLVFLWIFTLHEWEEQRYPGGFLDYIIELTGVNASEETVRGSRFTTGLYLCALTIVPLFAGQYAFLILPAGFLGIFEGFMHLMGIKLFQTPKPYTPGMLTAETEVLISVYSFYYLVSHKMVTGIHFLIGFVLMAVGFMIMQATLVHSTGQRYRDLPKTMLAGIARRRNMASGGKEST